MNNIIKEIKSTNDSNPNTPKIMVQQATPQAMKATSRSFSTDYSMNNIIAHNINNTSIDNFVIKMSSRDTPLRKYFDSGDYELARAGIVSSASVGSLHPNPEKMASYSRSGSSHHLSSNFILSTTASRDEINCGMVRNQSAPNTTHLQKSTSFIIEEQLEDPMIID